MFLERGKGSITRYMPTKGKYLNTGNLKWEKSFVLKKSESKYVLHAKKKTSEKVYFSSLLRKKKFCDKNDDKNMKPISEIMI